MKTMSDDDLTADDLVTWDELPEAVSNAIENEDVDLPSGDDAPEFGPEDAAEVTERKMTEFMSHLVHEDCETPECQDFRHAFGISDPSGGPSQEGGADETDDSDDEVEAEESEGNEDPSGSDGNNETGQDSGDESRTNYLGEHI